MLEFYREKYAKVTAGDVLPEDVEILSYNLDLLFDDKYLDYIAEAFKEVARNLRFQDLDGIVHDNNGTAVVECSHGVLTDAETGLKPHVSAIRTLPWFTMQMLDEADYDGEVVNLAVHRAYEIRHGAGPMPTYDAEFTAKMLPHSYKDENRWQGKVRAGPLDLNLVRYALEVCRNTRFDGVCWTWFDQILENDGIWSFCAKYKSGQTCDESAIGFFNRAEPILEEISMPISQHLLYATIKDFTKTQLGLNTAIVSSGPTEVEKTIFLY